MFQAFILLVTLLVSSVVATIYMFVFPYKFEQSVAMTSVHFVVGHWLLLNVVFHYVQATFTNPGNPAGVSISTTFNTVYVTTIYVALGIHCVFHFFSSGLSRHLRLPKWSSMVLRHCLLPFAIFLSSPTIFMSLATASIHLFLGLPLFPGGSMSIICLQACSSGHPEMT